MKINEVISKVIHDKEHSLLYLEAEGARAHIDYKIRKDRMYLTHSEVPVELRGNGIGKTLVEKSLEKLLEEGYDKEYKIIAKCSFIKYVVAKSPKWSEIVSK